MLGQLPKSQVSSLSSGQAGNLQTVQMMQKLAHAAAGDPLVQKLASLIVLDVPSHYYAEESKAIGNYVLAKVRYRMDPEGYEQLQAPALLIGDIQNGVAQGDCDDMALLTSALLLALGHNPFYAMVRYDSQDGAYAHIYCVDYATNPGAGTQRVVLDCILKDKPIGSEVDYASGDEIEV